MGARASRATSALAALSASEKATVLDELLAARPDLRGLAETLATRLMSNEDRSVVAGDVADALQGRDIEELNSHAGYRPGRGYVHPVEAADEILDEAFDPFLEYSPDYPAERAAQVVNRCATLGIALPGAELRDLVPEWNTLFR